MPSGIESYSRHFAHPVPLLSVSDGVHENVATMSWISPVSTRPPLLMVAVHPKRYTHELILKSKEFAILVLSNLQQELATLAGTISGKNKNKWDLPQFKLQKKKAKKIKAPLLKECRASLECKLVNHFTAGDHTIFISEVIESEFDPEVLPLILFNRKYINPGQFIANYP
jgi:flavin reductase (DIM6/NTAB) family NADH-FMN oxidoreductase RutF